MDGGQTRVYYHLYNGPSWRPVWALHAPRLEALIRDEAVERLVVCGYGFEMPPPLDLPGVELILSNRAQRQVNEFDTLARIRREACSSDSTFAHVAYLHSKGSSAARLTPQASSWTDWLSEAHAGLVTRFDALASAGYGAAGANLAWGVFGHFEPPRLHYSGNFWCATRAMIQRTATIDSLARRSSIRHDAEWWLSAASNLPHFNLFCSGLDHYSAEGTEVDRSRLAARLDSLKAPPGPVKRAKAQQAFVRQQLQTTLRETKLRRGLSSAALAALPYGRWPRLFSAHDRAMRLLGSRKSTYFYCAET